MCQQQEIAMNKEKVIIEALPERFDEIEKQGNMSIEEKYDLFSKEIRKAFEPVIKAIAEAQIREIEKAIPEYKDVKKRKKLPMSLVFKINDWLDTSEEDRPKLAIKWATDIMNPEIWKTEGKLILLENAKLDYYYDNEFVLRGSVFGSSVYIKQQVVFKRSMIGNDFVQFPARIYLDGKFTPEDIYKSWFREKGEGIFKDIEDIRSKIRAEISFKIGSLYLTEVKRKQKELQSGLLPYMVHQVIAVDKDFLTVRPLKVNRYMIKDKTSHRRYKTFDAIYRWSPDIFDGESEKWEVQSTPTKSRLIGRRNTSKVNYNSIRRGYNKQWRKWTPTHSIPSLPTEEDVIWKKTKAGYETVIMGKVFDIYLVPFTHMGWDNKEVKGIRSMLGKRTNSYFDIAPDSEYSFESVVSSPDFDPNHYTEELLKKTTKGLLNKIFEKETEDLAKRLEEGEDHE
jgi:hypothetical protein